MKLNHESIIWWSNRVRKRLRPEWVFKHSHVRLYALFNANAKWKKKRYGLSSQTNSLLRFYTMNIIHQRLVKVVLSTNYCFSSWGETQSYLIFVQKAPHGFECEYRTGCKTCQTLHKSSVNESSYEGSKIKKNKIVSYLNTVQHVCGQGDSISPFSIQTNGWDLRPTRSITPHTA